jgi:hypothetical protein
MIHRLDFRDPVGDIPPHRDKTFAERLGAPLIGAVILIVLYFAAYGFAVSVRYGWSCWTVCQ